MNRQNKEFIEKVNRVYSYRIETINKYKSEDIIEVFTLAYKFTEYFYALLLQNNESKEVLYDMFGKATNEQLDKAHQLLVFWFLWQRDWARNLSFLKSEKVRDGLKKIWSFSESEIDELKQEFDLESEKGIGGETTLFWKKIQDILENNEWSPLFIFPILSISLKKHWVELDLTVGDNI